MQRLTINNNNGFILFATEFKYLGSCINFLLDNTIDIKIRIKKVTKAISTLSFVWDFTLVVPKTKVNSYLAISVNLTL